MLLHVVRHAHAGDRASWRGDDRDRPLSSRGQDQARLIASHLAGTNPTVIRSSEAVRCIETVQPLADEAGIEIEIEDRLFEGNGLGALEGLVADLEEVEGSMVWCSHGDVIPRLLSIVVEQGVRPTHELVWQKASIWSLEYVDGAWGMGSYTPPLA